MEKALRIMVKSLTVLTLVLGTITLWQQNVKILKTSADLMVLRDYASFYNENPRKTDAMTEEYLKNDDARKAIYNSEDFVVRTFSNQKAIVKMIVMLCVLASFPLSLLMWGIFFVSEAEKFKRRKMRKRRRETRKRGVAA